ncbi:Os06g0695001 [Oryza sativa Japonica Group]|uniref:Os06g0695001 protein n=1 Tax=Oryza sativa subsp. japonica TaxID=39947 RepID=A0A0P0X0V2_ORYSJ|nr:hypothetical protein EE612_036234 [Oryza sativa]BAS99275.1 Os06g0695001 [Oryza sativa Japonica Group]
MSSVGEPAVAADLAAGGRRLDADPAELGHGGDEVVEEGALVGGVAVDEAAGPRVGVERLVGAEEAAAGAEVLVEGVVEPERRRGVEEREAAGAAAAAQHRREVGVHGRVAAEPVAEEVARRRPDAAAMATYRRGRPCRWG